MDGSTGVSAVLFKFLAQTKEIRSCYKFNPHITVSTTPQIKHHQPTEQQETAAVLWMMTALPRVPLSDIQLPLLFLREDLSAPHCAVGE